MAQQDRDRMSRDRMNRTEGEPKMPSFTPPEVPTNPDGTPDTVAMRREKEARLREIEGQRHPTDRRDGPSPEVGRALDPEVTER